MKPFARFNSCLLRSFWICATILLLFALSSCEDGSDKHAKAPVIDSAIIAIDNTDQFYEILEKSGEHLLMVEFYADWCSPCKELEPVLEKIARENKDKVTVYKIDTDRNRELLYSFRIIGIPHVIFVKNREKVFSLNGQHPEKTYLKIINQFAGAVKKKSDFLKSS